MTSTEPEPGHPQYLLGYMQGLADAGAQLVAAVAGELGPDHPLIDKMVTRLGILGRHPDSS
jgi:hypothetical protein